MADDEVDIAELLEDSEELLKVTDDQLRSVADLANHLVALEDTVDRLEGLLKSLKEQLTEVQDKKLPDRINELGLSGVPLANGVRVTLQKLYLPSIKVDDKPEVYAWMADNGFGSIIEANVVIPLGKGGLEQAKKIEHQLHNLGAVTKADIHWQTLRAFVREQLESGHELHPKFKVLQIDRAKVTRPKGV